MSLKRASLGHHGLLALPLAFASLPIYIHAPDFYATQFGIPLASIGILLLLLRIIDALQDPLIGTLSDKFYDQRHWIMMIGVAMLCGGFWMVFHPMTESPLLWLGLSIVICTTGFSIASINLQTAGSLWQVTPAERTRVSGVREGFGLIGLLTASVIPVLLTQRYDPQQALHLLSLGYIPLLVIGSLAFFYWLRYALLAHPETTNAIPYRQLLRAPWLKRFMSIYALSSFASSIPGVLVLFYVRDHLQAESQTGLFLLVYFLSGAFAMPIWQHIAKKRGKIDAWIAGTILACVTFIWAFFLEQGDVYPFLLVCLFSGIALGADLALPPAIIADQIASLKHERAASRYYSLLAFFSKAALALATGIMLPALGWAGYQPGQIDLTGVLPIAYALIPCTIKAGVAFLLIAGRASIQREPYEKNNIT